jgi:hypothetical protein
MYTDGRASSGKRSPIGGSCALRCRHNAGTVIRLQVGRQLLCSSCALILMSNPDTDGEDVLIGNE